MNPAVADLDGLPATQSHKVLGKLCSRGHRGIADKRRNYTKVALKCLGNLHSYEVILLIQAPASLRVGRDEPRLSDDGDKHVAGRDGLIDALDKVLSRPDVIDVDEHLISAEVFLEPIGQTAGVRSAVVSTIADKNPGHVPPCRLGTRHCLDIFTMFPVPMSLVPESLCLTGVYSAACLAGRCSWRGGRC